MQTPIYELCDQCAADLLNGEPGQVFSVTHAGIPMAHLRLSGARESRSVPAARHPASPEHNLAVSKKFDGIAQLRERRKGPR